ncbi:MAG TPA: YCF48-related protein [Blastocatellia bacterium]|nr:YCF48-related protein [Blastocatellia bacterium]
MKRSLILIFILISLISTTWLTIETTAAGSQNPSGEAILADAALFSQEARDGFERERSWSPSSKVYYSVADGQGPTIASIRARYSQPAMARTEAIPVTVRTTYARGDEVATEAPPVIWQRQMLVFYYGDVGFAVEDSADESVVRFVTNRVATPNDEPGTPPPFAPTGARLESAQAATWGQKPSGTSQELRSVNFVSEAEGWAAGANATLLHTTNGGDTWSAVATGADPTKGFGTVGFLSQNAGFVASPTLFGRTLNGGASWTVAPLPKSVLVAVNVSHNGFFPRVPELFWTCGDGVFSPSSTTTVGVIAIYNVSPTGALSEAASIVSAASSSLKYLDIHILDSSGGWVVGASGLIATITLSSPLPIQFQSSGTTQQLNAVQMLSFSSGWAVGNGGTILKYTGNGRWVSQSSGTTANLRDVYFLDSNRGWAVGDGGTIVGTTDGGSTWVADVSGVSADLRGVHAASAGAVFAVGAGGMILKRGEALAGPDFSLSFEPATVTAERGTTGRSVLTINRTGGFTGNIDIAAVDSGGIGVKVKPPEASTTGNSVTLKFKVKGGAAVGAHELTFVGKDSAGRTRSAKVMLVIQ